MAIQVECQCGQRLAVPKKKIGRQVTCPSCGAQVAVPVPVWTPVAPEALPEVKPPEPVYSGYMLPAPKQPSILSRIGPWIMGAVIAVVLFSVLGAAIYGLARLRALVEPPAPGMPAVTAKDD